jgi:hypothetical protein
LPLKLFQSCSLFFQSTWHEIVRPQIHGYDLQCLSMVNRWEDAITNLNFSWLFFFLGFTLLLVPMKKSSEFLKPRKISWKISQLWPKLIWVLKFWWDFAALSMFDPSNSLPAGS